MKDKELNYLLNIGLRIYWVYSSYLKVSQEEFAKIINVSSRQIYRWEHALSWPSLLSLHRISQASGIPVSLILTDSEEEWFGFVNK